MTDYSKESVDATIEREDRLVGNPDATAWSEEFVSDACRRTPEVVIERHHMLGWFASAIETGRTTGQQPLTRLLVSDEALERACEVMHDAYEAAAPAAGWETNLKSRTVWRDVPEANKATMRAAVRALAQALLNGA
jgi:hypothetical protein